MQYFDTNNKTKCFHDAERFPQAINISSYFRMVLFCSTCYFHSLKRFPMKNSLNNRGQFWTKQRQQEHKEAVLNEWFLQFHLGFTVLHASYILPEVVAWANLVHCHVSTSWNQWLICLWFQLTLYVSYFKFSNVSKGHATRPLMAAQCTIQGTTKNGILMSTVVEWN